MPTIHDKEFGNITIRRSPMATQVRIRVAADGTLKASLPMHTPLFFVKHLVKTSRNELRELLVQSAPIYDFRNGMQIGKSHVLTVLESKNDGFQVSRRRQKIIVELPDQKYLNHPDVSRKIRETVISALRVEARSYLPKRLSFLAEKHGYEYGKIRFSHSSGRWGSYSSAGTVSLNIAIMKLPFELIDYILIHELTHSRQMNHSNKFWSLVERADPDYLKHRRSLRQHNPSI